MQLQAYLLIGPQWLSISSQNLLFAKHSRSTETPRLERLLGKDGIKKTLVFTQISCHNSLPASVSTWLLLPQEAVCYTTGCFRAVTENNRPFQSIFTFSANDSILYSSHELIALLTTHSSGRIQKRVGSGQSTAMS